MRFLTDKKIQLFLAWGMLLVPLYPLAVWSGFLFPFITSKTLFLYALIEIVFALWLIAALRGLISLTPLRSLVSFAFGTFLLLFALTSVFGVDFWQSFWSTYERMDGLLTWIHLGALFIILTTVASEKLWRRFTVLSLFVYFLVSLGAVWLWFVSGMDARVGGVFDNPSYLASYTLLHIFFIGYVYSKAHSRTTRFILIGLLLLGVLTLIASGTRGAFLGLASGGMLIALLTVWRRITLAKNAPLLIRGVLIGIIALILSLGVWGAGILYNSISSPDRTIPISIEKVLEEPRIAVWRIAWQGIKERPLFGWGGGAFGRVFDTWYDPQLSLEEPWFDRAHSIVFEWLIAGGIVLFLGYASLFTAALFLLWVHPGRRVFNHAAQFAFSGFFAAYIAHGVFLFDTIAGLVPLVATLAYLNWSAAPSVKHEKPHRHSPVVPFVVLGMLLFALSSFVFAPAYVLSHANESVNPANSDEKRSAAFTRSFNNALFDKENLAILFSKSVVDASNSPSGTPLFAQAQSALNGLTASESASTRLLIATGAMALTAGDPSFAITTLERAHNRAPKRKDTLRFLGEAYRMNHEYARSTEVYQSIFELESLFPHDTAHQYYIDQTRIEYASALIYEGRITDAEAVIHDRFGMNYVFDARLIDALLSQKQFSPVISLLKAEFASQPAPQMCFSLAAAYLSAGENSASIDILRECGQRFPETRAQTENLIAGIRNGTITAEDL